MNYPTIENEFLVIVFTLDKIGNYIMETSIIIFIDHSTLKNLPNKKDAKKRLIWYIIFLQEFNVQIKDKQEVRNVVTNHLSQVRVESHLDEP